LVHAGQIVLFFFRKSLNRQVSQQFALAIALSTLPWNKRLIDQPGAVLDGQSVRLLFWQLL
jgi:hypothetical protein